MCTVPPQLGAAVGGRPTEALVGVACERTPGCLVQVRVTGGGWLRGVVGWVVRPPHPARHPHQAFLPPQQRRRRSMRRLLTTAAPRPLLSACSVSLPPIPGHWARLRAQNLPGEFQRGGSVPLVPLVMRGILCCSCCSAPLRPTDPRRNAGFAWPCSCKLATTQRVQAVPPPSMPPHPSTRPPRCPPPPPPPLLLDPLPADRHIPYQPCR